MQSQELKVGTVEFEGKRYSLQEKISANSPLLAELKALVTENLKLGDFIQDLSNCGALIDLSYNEAANLTAVRTAVLNLHDKYHRLCVKCDETFHKTSSEAKRIQDNLVDAVASILQDDDLSAAKEILQMVSESAKKLYQGALDLSVSFDTYLKAVIEVLKNEESIQTGDESKQKIEEEVNVLEANKQKVDKSAETSDNQNLLRVLPNENSDQLDSQSFKLVLDSSLMSPIPIELQMFGNAKKGSLLGQHFDQEAVKSAEDKLKYLQTMEEKERQEFEQREVFKEYIAKLEASLTGKGLEACMYSLMLVVGILTKTGVNLTRGAEFWKQTIEGDGSNKLEMWAEKTTPEDRKKVYADKEFCFSVLRNYAGWKALEIVSEEYSKKASEVGTQVAVNFKENRTPEQMKAKATELGRTIVDHLLTQTKRSQSSSLIKRKSIEERITQTEAQIKKV